MRYRVRLRNCGHALFVSGIKLMAKGPGALHFEELFKLYRKTTPTDRLQLEKDLRSITISPTENPKYKTIKPTPNDLYATILRALPQYLVMHMSKDLSILRQEDAPRFAIIEKMETIAEDLYNTMAVKGITKSSGNHKEMTMFGAEVTNIVEPYERNKWAAQAVCYWCQEKGHKAYQFPRNTNDNNSNNNTLVTAMEDSADVPSAVYVVEAIRMYSTGKTPGMHTNDHTTGSQRLRGMCKEPLSTLTSVYEEN
eukprot:jgi/Psemu1/32342/gm1.32342_g